MADPTAPLAFFAGLVSFLSPCVLPLVPGYLSYMSGLGAADLSQGRATRTTLVATTFVLGFSAVFVALGATATYLGSLLNANQDVLTRAGGAAIVLMGLVFMGLIKVPWLYREARFHPSPRAGVWGSAVLGAAFAFGWSPCIGATMGAALTMAAGHSEAGGVGQGAFLLGMYSLGLGVPFVLAGIGVSRLTEVVRWLRSHARAINLAGGAVMIAVGLLFITGDIFRISIWMQKTMTAMNLDFWSGI
jgi:cytochrome c-type biogenesis protein